VSSSEQKLSRRAVQILLTLLAFYVLLALFITLAQRRFIYLPTKLSPQMAEVLARERGFTPWRNAVGGIIGWHLPVQRTPAASVLIAHGNAGSALNRGYIAEPIHALGGIDIFVLEYPGYGSRDGSPSMGSFLAAAEEALPLLPTDRPVYIVAESLGAGVAAHLAKRHESRVFGLLFFAPYADLAAVGQRQMPIFPVKLLIRDRFLPSKWLENYRGPVKVVLAEADNIIPARFGQKLYDNYKGPKSIEVIRDAGHNDIAAQEAGWWREVFLFWEEKRSAE